MSEKNKQEVYEVTVTETLERVVYVKADSMEDARELVRIQYRREEIVLDAEDFVSVEFEVKEPDREIHEEKVNDRTERSDSRGR